MSWKDVPATDGVRVTAVDVALVSLPMAAPVRVGRTVYREREYAILRVRLEDGSRGDAFGYTRGLPLDVMLERLAPSIVGADATHSDAVLADLRALNRSAAAALARAISLVDISLRDAAARRAGVPLWRQLGGTRDRVPLVAVGGYARRDGGIDGAVDELRCLADQGYRGLKLHTADPELAGRVASALSGSVRLGVDAGMAWESVDDAVEGCGPLDDLGLDFIEDPFPPQHWRMYVELATRLRTSLAAGEDAAGPEQLRDLLEGIALLRVDATASGGIGAVLDVAADAAMRGRRVMTHAFPDLHAHLAGSPAIEAVEQIPDATGVNPIGRLLARRQRIEDGELVLSHEPGHGAPLDWDKVTGHARRMSTFTEPRAEGE
jgi:L-alanine-DL-glutamate epimerase-like enolase superfamily enzyme